MLESVQSILSEQCLLAKEKPIVVGVSGGSDSLCLMSILKEAGYPIIVAHFNHHLRPEAGADALAVENIAANLKIPSVVDGADVRAFSERGKLSIEEAARILRYRFLFGVARQKEAQAVAVGHTADDQVETVLMHFLRGSGLTGLKGMSYRTILKTFDPEIPVVRPLLDVWREDAVVYCAASGLRPHYDQSNDSMNFLRNRLRRLLIPHLETYNPKFREAVFRMTKTLKSDHALISDALESAWEESAIHANEKIIAFDIRRFSQCAPGLQRNMIRRAIKRLRPEHDTDFASVERAFQYINNPHSPSRTNLKDDLLLIRETDRIYICSADADLLFNRWPQLPGNAETIAVSIPGSIELSGGWKFSCERWRHPSLAREQSEKNEDPFQVWLDTETLPASLELRARRPGDRFESLGMNGHSQKLSDFFINEKMPRQARARWPLLCSGKTVIWAPGYRPAHPYRLTPSSRTMTYFAVIHPPEKQMN